MQGLLFKVPGGKELRTYFHSNIAENDRRRDAVYDEFRANPENAELIFEGEFNEALAEDLLPKRGYSTYFFLPLLAPYEQSEKWNIVRDQLANHINNEEIMLDAKHYQVLKLNFIPFD